MTTTYDQSTVTYDQSTLTYQGLPTQFDGISFVVEMAFGYEPLDTSPQWKPVTPYVRGFTINRGRSSEFSTYSPGTVSIALDNRDRRFDPEHTTGPYFGDLNPMVPVRVQATYSGTTYTMFYGFVTGWPTVYNQSNTDAVASVTAVDATRLLANLSLPSNDFVNYMIDTQSWQYMPLQTADIAQPSYTAGTLGSGGTLNDYPPQQAIPVGDLGVGTRATMDQDGRFPNPYSPYGLSFWLYNPSGAPITLDIFALGFGVPFSYQAYLILRVVNNRVYVRWSNGSTFGVTLGTPYYDTGYDLDPNVSVQHIGLWLSKLYVNAVEVDSWSTGVLADTYINDQGIELQCGSGSFISHLWVTQVGTVGAFETYIDQQYAQGVSPYDGELSSARLTRALDDAGWPATWRNIETGDQAVGNYTPQGKSPNDYNDQINNAEQGALFVNREGYVEFRSRTTADVANIVGLFDDSSIDLPFTNVAVDAHTVDAIRNNVIVNYAFGSTLSTDSASVTAYGQATQTIDAKLISDATVAQSIGDNLLARTKDPRTRITRLDVNVRSDPAGIVPVVAALDLSDDVTVSLTPTGVGAALWRAVRVQGIQHTVTPETWDVALYLAPGPINTNGPLLVLNDDTYGELDNNKLG